MANLAIRGHKTRGEEVIEILEMLGGKNISNFNGNYIRSFYFLNNNIICDSWCSGKLLNIDCYTLEEFLEKFPYKVGDKVLYYGNPVFITQIEWIADSVSYHFYHNGKELMLPSKHLQPYKEETTEDIIKIDIPKGYGFAEVDNNTQQVVFTKIQPEYPKTYEECCRIIDYHLEGTTIIGYNKSLLENFQKLLICRDAYWKHAGEEMGLNKPWEPDWLNVEQDKYVLYTHNNSICSNCYMLGNNILAFPTEEMRDVFYENFKDLIEQCKDLL
jgi:hypothetical protein